jgi:glycogen phosphorylase
MDRFILSIVKIKSPHVRVKYPASIVLEEWEINPMDTNPASTSILTADELTRRINYHLRYSLMKDPQRTVYRDLFYSLALSCRELLIDRMFETERRYSQHRVKRLYYISIEYLLGRSLSNNLYNLGIYDMCREIFSKRGIELADILEEEPDPALGNGGLGRLAACFLDSLAALDMPGYGFGINYEFGLFRQIIEDGRQEEKPDHWLARDCPWQIKRADEACFIPAYGKVTRSADRHGEYNPMWTDWNLIVGVPHDVPIAGCGGRTVNVLRLYSARSSNEFDIRIFNEGDYLHAVQRKIESESVSKMLYPQAETASGKELRLLQEYFLVACSLRDIFTRHLANGLSLDRLPEYVAIQINDTHPSLVIAELMRLLVDERSLPWNQAWEIARATCGYTNHTLLPEALERWPMDLMGRVLPRHLEIIYEINRRLLQAVEEHWPGDSERLRRISVIEDGPHPQVRMAHLAVVGSHAINGVSELHTELLKNNLLSDFYQLWPERFSNKTNGVSHRRWMLFTNPGLSELLSRAIGSSWIADPMCLRDLSNWADDSGFQTDIHAAKQANKERLAQLIGRIMGIQVDVHSLFDVHAKRFHEYKRQLLNVLQIVHQYLRITEDGETPSQPHTYIFAGKASAGYYMAKLIIQFIHSVAEIISSDPLAHDWMQLIFLPDYRVSLAETIIPAADLSEQISTAGWEASGTGVMKFAMNGALTIGTHDGANIEILREVGMDNIYLFGLLPQQAAQLAADWEYHPRNFYRHHSSIQRVMDAIAEGRFDTDARGAFRPLVTSVLDSRDPYFHLADLDSYIAAHIRASEDFSRSSDWTRKAILNVAGMGKFSSDRTIREYAGDIWNILPAPLTTSH